MEGIVRNSIYNKALSVSLRYISHKDRTADEVINRLKKDGCSDGIIDSVMSFLGEQGYVNDRRYAEYYIECYKDKRSIARIMQDLRKKGIDNSLLEEVMESADIDTSYAVGRALRKQLTKRGITDTCGMSYEDRNKVAAALARQGYSADDIRKEMESACR